MLHIHVLLVAPLGASHVAQPGADQHKGRVAVRESTHYPSAAADLSVESLNKFRERVLDLTETPYAENGTYDVHA